MIRSVKVSITAAVGHGGENRRHDVAAVQALIDEHLPAGTARLAVDGVAGPRTIAAIEHCQRQFVRLPQPDGRVDPHGPTLRLLNAMEAAPHPLASPPAHPAAAPGAPGSAGPATRPPSGHAPSGHPASLPAARPGPPAATRPVAAPALPAAVPGFPAEVIAAARTAQARTRIPAAITLAQWAVESGHGRHMPAASNNPFGIKAVAGQPYVEARTREVIHGRTVYIDARFRKFASLDEAFAKHGELLATGRPYAHARTFIDDPDRFADALTGVYATDPNYGTLLKQVMRSADLYRFD